MRSPYSQPGYQVKVDWGAAGGDAIGLNATITAIVDILSFTTTLTVCVDNGIEVFPCRWHDGAAAAYAADRNAVLAVGRSEARSRPGQVSLSPTSIRYAHGIDRLVLPSPNGSAITRDLAGHGATIIGVALRNITAAADWAARRLRAEVDSSLAVIAAGERWADGSLRPAVEDLWGAGAYVAALANLGVRSLSPEAGAAVGAYAQVAGRIGEALEECASGRELLRYGFREDVEIAAELESSTAIPVLSGESFKGAPG
jgi:2-phosphosulfolactate phosphatase